MRDNNSTMKSFTWMSGRLSVQILLVLILVLILILLRSLSNMKIVFVNLQPHSIGRIDAELVILPESYVASQMAFCLDGSRPGYFMRHGHSSSKNKWILHLPSGAWCVNSTDCATRSQTRLGSTSFERNTRTLKGIMSADVNINPHFYDWNIVEFVYCDGSSFVGNLSEPIVYHGKPLYMRGAIIFKVMVEYLLENTHLSIADHVLLTGSSAGSLAVLLNVDFLKDKLPKTVLKIQAVVDGGLFLDLPDINGQHLMRNMLKDTFDLHNIKDASVLTKCTNQMKENDKWKCFLPEVFHKYVSSPTYFLNSYYDTWYDTFMLNVQCGLYGSKCSLEEETVMKKVTEAVTSVSQEILKKSVNGVYLTSCTGHTVINKNKMFKFQSQGLTPARALKLWLNNDDHGQKVTELGPYKNCSAGV